MLVSRMLDTHIEDTHLLEFILVSMFEYQVACNMVFLFAYKVANTFGELLIRHSNVLQQ